MEIIPFTNKGVNDMESIKYGRKRSGIERELNEKISDWISSIKNDDVRKLAERDTVLMGGAIASMLLGEPINDFDIYFKTKETAKVVAEYYCKEFSLINDNEWNPIVREETIKNCKGIEEERICIFIESAGVAGENPEKYELFEQQPNATDDKEMDDKGKYRPLFLSQNAISLSNKMQIVIRFSGEPEKVFESYDFAHAMNYYDYKSNKLVLDLEALECLLSRTLVYRGSLYPIASIWRMKKFINRGWRISAGQQLKIMWQISELNLKDISVIREQITGVDAAYLHLLIDALEGVDGEKIDSTYVATVIDRIFGE